MKNRIRLMLLFAMTMLIWSCNEASKKGNESNEGIAKTEKTEKKNAGEELLENLKNTEPVDEADLEACMPKTLGGLSLERTKPTSVFNEIQTTGWYKRDGNKIIILSFADAAGPNARMIADKIKIFGTEPDSDAEDIQMRSVNVKGRMARQDCSIKKNMTSITFFHNKRFMIKITAFDHSAEETWNLVDELNFNALDNLIK